MRSTTRFLFRAAKAVSIFLYLLERLTGFSLRIAKVNQAEMVLGSLRGGLSRLLPASNTENSSQSPFSPGTNICGWCTCIELDKILRNLSDKLKQAESTESDDSQGHVFQVHDLGAADTWNPGVCALCFLFEAVRKQSADVHQVYMDPSVRYDLKAIPLANLVSRDGKAPYKHLVGNVNMALALCVDGQADLALSGALPLIAKSLKFWHFQDRVGTHADVLSDQFNVRLVRKWLSFCQRHSRCRENVTNESDDFRPALLINCYSRRVVQPKQAEAYVALSYVWGSIATSNNRSGTAARTAKAGALLPSNIPAVVEDAMHVAKSLGVVYLWVDRFCIDQSDEQQTAHEIRHMHQIFARALLTIVAASGPGAESGLCGTRGTSRKACPVRAVVQGLSLHIMPPDPAKAVEKSAWETRGWTYQEMVLSNRRLFFTPTEVFYECRTWRYREAIDEPSGYLSDAAAPGRDLPSNSHMREHGLRRDPPESWFYHIEMYSRRNLTYSTDAFAAFRGILSFYETLKEPWYHVWGLILGGSEAADVFLTNPDPYLTVADCSPLKYLARSLMWSHVQEEAELRGSSCERTPELPSWSWVGWKGAKSLKMCRFAPKCEEKNNKLQAASLELTDGSSHPIECIEDARIVTECASQWSNILKLRAPLISIQSIKDEIRSLDNGKRWLAVHTVPEGRPVDVFVDVSTDPSSLFTRAHSTDLHALVLGAGCYFDHESDKDADQEWQLRVLVIEEIQPNLWARGGVMILYSSGYKEFTNISWNVKEIRMC